MKIKIKSTDCFRVILPENNDVTFDSLIDLNDQKSELTGLIKYINSDRSSSIPLYNKFFLIGPDGCGKKSLAIAFAKEINVPIVIVSIESMVGFSEDIIEKKLNKVYKVCNKLYKIFGNCVIYYDKFIYLNADSSKDASADRMCLSSLFINNIKQNDHIITFAGTPNSIFYTFVYEALEKKIVFLYPEVKIREALFKRFCEEHPIDDKIDYDSLARDIYDVTAGDIKKFVKLAYNYAINKGKTYISQSDIEEVIAKHFYGDKRKKPTDEERIATAYHEAGHAIAGYYSNIKDLNKVEIIHRDSSLGLTITRIDEDKFSMTAEEYENEIYFSLGGYAAEKLLLNTTTSGVSMDLYQATAVCYAMVNTYGMDDEIGPVSIFFDERVFFEELSKESEKVVQKRMKKYMEHTINLIKEHLDEVKALADALIENEVVMIDEMIKIIDEVKAKKKVNN